MSKKTQNNLKKYETDIIKNYKSLASKGFLSLSHQSRTFEKINRIRKKEVSQQVIDSIVNLEMNHTQKVPQNQDPNIEPSKNTNNYIIQGIDLDNLISELESFNKNLIENTQNFQKSSSDNEKVFENHEKNDDEIEKNEKTEIQTIQIQKIPENENTNSELLDDSNILSNYQLKALLELRKRSEEISNEITRLIQSDQPETTIDQLRQERRNIWEKIENLEKGIQVANELFRMQNPNSLINDETTNSKNDNKEKQLQFKSSSSDNDSEYDLSDLYTERNENVVFDENSSDFYDFYPEEKDKIDPTLFEKITQINHEVFHHAKFRGCQAAAIEAVLNKKDVFLLMPTGGGKSLVYQIAGYYEKKLTIIISPLISLIKDQVASLKELNLTASSLTGETSKSEYKEIIEMINNNRLLFLYITPEKLLSSTNLLDFFYTINQSGKIARFVIDEAHCVSQWGHDFRPAYTDLDIIKNRYENLPILVMTATATSAVKKDIINILKIPNCQVFQMSFNRPNLIYQVVDKGENYKSFRTILTFINEHHFENKCGIIFCMTIADTEAVSSFLNDHGLRARYYHAQMKNKMERHDVQQLWMKGKINIIVATLAFGMGIDKPDVRFVIHHTMPKSIEAYYQESGRAGRDGLRSYCLLLFNYSDRQRVERLIRCEYISSEQTNRLGIELQLLDAMTNYCLDRTTCRRVILLNYFNENFNPEDCNPKCDNCIRKENGNISIIKADLTKHAEEMADIINEITLKRQDQPPYPTPRYVISIYLGTESTRASVSGDSKMKQFGIGADMSLKDYLLHQAFPILIEKKILKIRIKLVKHGTIQYFATGPSYDEYKRNGFPNIEVEDEIKARFEGMSKEDSELFPILLEKRRMLAEDRSINPNSICSMKVLKDMVKERPKYIDDFAKIPTITNKKVKEYGKYFMEAISKFESQIKKNNSISDSDSPLISNDNDKFYPLDDIDIVGTVVDDDYSYDDDDDSGQNKITKYQSSPIIKTNKDNGVQFNSKSSLDQSNSFKFEFYQPFQNSFKNKFEDINKKINEDTETDFAQPIQKQFYQNPNLKQTQSFNDYQQIVSKRKNRNNQTHSNNHQQEKHNFHHNEMHFPNYNQHRFRQQQHQQQNQQHQNQQHQHQQQQKQQHQQHQNQQHQQQQHQQQQKQQHHHQKQKQQQHHQHSNPVQQSSNTNNPKRGITSEFLNKLKKSFSKT